MIKNKEDSLLFLVQECLINLCRSPFELISLIETPPWAAYQHQKAHASEHYEDSVWEFLSGIPDSKSDHLIISLNYESYSTDQHEILHDILCKFLTFKVLPRSIIHVTKEWLPFHCSICKVYPWYLPSLWDAPPLLILILIILKGIKRT